MRRSLLIKNCQSFSIQQPKSKRSKNIYPMFGFKLIFTSLFLMAVISSSGYLFQINQLATTGQEINQKEQSLKQLKEQNEVLEVRVAQLKASYQFENERERLNLVNPEQVSFIEIDKNDIVAMITK